jgi:hypothetical protein
MVLGVTLLVASGAAGAQATAPLAVESKISLGDIGGRYASLGRIATLPGARTRLFIPEIDRLVVAARASGSEPAALWVLRPSL